MASRHGYSAFLIAASLLMLSGLSVLYLGTDCSDGINEGFECVRTGDDVTVTGHGTLGYDSSWSGLKTLTLVPEGGTIDISVNAFRECGSITSLTVNGPVGTIGNSAFSGCDSLTSVTVNGSVGTIGNDAFYDCGSLTSVTVNGSVGTIGYNTFRECGSLTSVTVNGSVGTIGGDAFYDCGSLTSVTIDGPVDTIMICAFFLCGNLSELTVTGPITTIGDSAFEYCVNLKTLNIACNQLNITAHSLDNGFIAEHADTVNHVHRYSATYGWSDDGSSCTVHIVCANTSDHDHDVTDATITSTVKVDVVNDHIDREGPSHRDREGYHRVHSIRDLRRIRLLRHQGHTGHPRHRRGFRWQGY